MGKKKSVGKTLAAPFVAAKDDVLYVIDPVVTVAEEGAKDVADEWDKFTDLIESIIDPMTFLLIGGAIIAVAIIV